MTTIKERTGTAAGETATARGVDMKFEIVLVPVSDVDRAKRFYGGLGWRLDAEAAVEDGYRLMQFTPPGSGCSIIFGEGVTSAPPGSAEGLHLAVYDIDEARADLIARGVEVSETFHDRTGVFHHAGNEGRLSGPAEGHRD